MWMDPRLVKIAENYAAARAAYAEHIKQFAHPVQWPMLTPQKQRDWYDMWLKENGL